MSLSKVLEEIKKTKPFAEEDVETGPIETLNGRRGRKNQAIERMKTLKFEYQQDLRQSAVFIVVVGDKRNEFTSTAVESFKCFSTDPELFYEDLASRIPDVLWKGKESVSNLFDILGRHLEDKARELGITEYPQMTFKQQYRAHISSKEDLVSLVKRAINEQVGSEVVGIQTVYTLTDTAINNDHGAKITPIVLNTADSFLALELESTLRRLNPRGVFLVVAGKKPRIANGSRVFLDDTILVKDPSKEEVEKVLTDISTSVKK